MAHVPKISNLTLAAGASFSFRKASEIKFLVQKINRAESEVDGDFATVAAVIKNYYN